MARLIVRNRDKVNLDDADADALCMKRGMVVDILPDGMSLGREGETYDGWTIVEVPGAEPEELAEFLTRHAVRGVVGVNGKSMLARRLFKLDLDSLEKSGQRRLSLEQVKAMKRASE